MWLGTVPAATKRKSLQVVRPSAARRVVGLVLAAGLLVGCSNDADPVASTNTASDTGTPTPSPTSTWKLRPVLGERTTTVLPLGSRPLLGLGANPEPDQAAIEAAVAAVGDWLDAHLDALQRTGEGAWGVVAAEDLATPKERTQVTTDLTSPDRPVRKARYVMTVYQDGTPQYLTTRVEVTHPDGAVDDVGLVFVVADDGTPRLSMFGPDAAPKASE